MKFKLILCLTLLILIALGGLHNLAAKTINNYSNTSWQPVWAHTWQDLKRIIAGPSPSSSELIFVLNVPFLSVFVVKLPSTFNEEMQKKKEFKKAIKEMKNVGANKKLRRGQ